MVPMDPGNGTPWELCAQCWRDGVRSMHDLSGAELRPDGRTASQLSDNDLSGAELRPDGRTGRTTNLSETEPAPRRSRGTKQKPQRDGANVSTSLPIDKA